MALDQAIATVTYFGDPRESLESSLETLESSLESLEMVSKKRVAPADSTEDVSNAKKRARRERDEVVDEDVPPVNGHKKASQRAKLKVAAPARSETTRKTQAQPASSTNSERIKAKNAGGPVKHPTHGHTPGIVLTLGQGDTGQLGLGEKVLWRSKPGNVELPIEVVQVCAGGMHSVCVSTNGKVYTWGCNDNGALGRQTPEEEDVYVPGVVDLPVTDIVQVSAGDSHTAALSGTGKVYAWGTFRDESGYIGLTPDGVASSTPIELLRGLTVAKIVSGDDHLVALTTDGDVYTVGNSQQGQLGRVPEWFANRGGRKGLGMLLTPTRVFCDNKKIKFENVWAGSYNTYAKACGTGKLYCWGLNNYFQLGIDDMKNRYMPECSKGFSPELDWKDVSCGQHHALALDGQGRVYSWGNQHYGRLGTGREGTETKVPTLIPALSDVKCASVNSASNVSYAVSEQGLVYAWGMGSNGQLGQSEEEDLYEPTVMTGKQMDGKEGLKVSAGGQHTMVLVKP